VKAAESPEMPEPTTQHVGSDMGKVGRSSSADTGEEVICLLKL